MESSLRALSPYKEGIQISSWASLAKHHGQPRIVLVNVQPLEDERVVRAGLAFVRGGLRQRSYVLRDLDTGERIRLEFTPEMREAIRPSWWIDEELRVADG